MMLEVSVTYRFISANFRVILNVPLDVLAPNDWVVVVRFEEFHNIVCPCFNSLKPLATEDAGQVSVDSNDGGGSNVITEDPKRCDRLPVLSEL